MAITLILEDGTGLATSNTFASSAEGDTYHEAHLYATAWTGATSGNKDIALAMATRLLDAHLEWHGSRSSSTQALGWPRVGSTTKDGVLLASDEVPAQVKNATVEFARVLLGTDRTAERDSIGLKKIKVGSVETEFDPDDMKTVIPASVLDLISDLAKEASVGGYGTVDLLRA